MDRLYQGFETSLLALALAIALAAVAALLPARTHLGEPAAAVSLPMLTVMAPEPQR